MDTWSRSPRLGRQAEGRWEELHSWAAAREVWLVFFVVRDKKLRDMLDGGMLKSSVLLSELVDRYVFNAARGTDFGTTGVFLHLGDGLHYIDFHQFQVKMMVV